MAAILGRALLSGCEADVCSVRAGKEARSWIQPGHADRRSRYFQKPAP